MMTLNGKRTTLRILASGELFDIRESDLFLRV